MTEVFIATLKQTLMITAFVLFMMVVYMLLVGLLSGQKNCNNHRFCKSLLPPCWA